MTILFVDSTLFKINYLLLDLIAAYKQGFRWRPAAYTVPMTDPTSVPLSMLPSTPRYLTVPSEPYTATGAGLDSAVWAPETVGPASPFGTAPTPKLQTSIPRVYWKFNPRLDLRKHGLLDKSTGPVDLTSTEQSDRPTTSQPPAPTVTDVTVTPVEVTGVPGSSHAGVDTVCIICCYNTF